MTEEVKEGHVEHKEHVEHEKKSGISKLGKNKKEILENVSFFIIIASVIAFSAGIAIGAFVQGSVILSILGSFFIMTGIVVYVISQFIEV